MLSCHRAAGPSQGATLGIPKPTPPKFQPWNAGSPRLCAAHGFPLFALFFLPVLSRDLRFWLKPSWEEPPEGMKAWEGWLRAGAPRVDPGSVSGWGFGAAHPRDAHMAVGPSQISSSLCSIISRRMEYLCFSFFTSRSSSSSSFWMKLLRMGISNLMYWATS